MSLDNISDIEEFEELYMKEDTATKKVIDKYLKILGMGISNLIMLLDPNTVIIGGDINNLLNDKIDILKKNIYKDNLFTDENNCTISIADYKESYLLGSAMMPIEEFLEIK